MITSRSAWIAIVCTAALSVSACVTAGDGPDADGLEQQVSGLWRYTGLATSAGVEMPLAGIFLFKDGVFLQQAVFDGEPFEAQGAMAHAGPYHPEAEWVHLVAEQTISTDPQRESPLTSRGRTEHDVTVSRSGDAMTLIFDKGTGTVQRFERVGPGEGELYAVENGRLAFVDGHFVLVQGNEAGVITGYGTFEKSGESLALHVMRWTEATASSVTNLRDTTLRASFDGQSLTLEDGRSIRVTR